MNCVAVQARIVRGMSHLWTPGDQQVFNDPQGINNLMLELEEIAL